MGFLRGMAGPVSGAICDYRAVLAAGCVDPKNDAGRGHDICPTRHIPDAAIPPPLPHLVRLWDSSIFRHHHLALADGEPALHCYLISNELINTYGVVA